MREGHPPRNSAVKAGKSGSVILTSSPGSGQKVKNREAATVLISIQAASERPMTHILTDKLGTNIRRACDRPARRALQVAAVVALGTLICSKAWKMHF